MISDADQNISSILTQNIFDTQYKISHQYASKNPSPESQKGT